MNFRNLKWTEIVSVYIIRIKGSSYNTLVQIFPEFHTWVQFNLEGETIFQDL